MTFAEKIGQRKDAIRKEQADLKKCIDEIFDAEIFKVIHEECEYQQKCPHPDIIVTTYPDGSGSKKCPECGWWCAWGVYSTVPAPKPPYPHKDRLQKLLRRFKMVS